VGLAEAARLAAAGLADETSRLLALRREIESLVLGGIRGSHLNGGEAPRTPNTANFRFDGVDGEDLVKRLDRDGFALSTGAACSAGAVSPSHVLLAMGLTLLEVQGSIRVSLGRSTRIEDARAFASALASAVEASRAKGFTDRASA
jgi:cysteine desulfurase